MDDVLTAVIADDEPLLREALARELAALWPALSIVATATNGIAAIELIEQHKPDIVFLDIRMPGASGIEVAESIADDWPAGNGEKAPPLIVFVTAYDDYAIDAFKTAAIDYLLKPVTTERLQTTVDRLHHRLQSTEANDVKQPGSQIRQLIEAGHSNSKVTSTDQNPLRIIRASVGDMVRMIRIDDVILFESADKYVTVYTAKYEALIRESLRSLLPQLDNNRFAQIHRGAIVNLDQVEAAIKDDAGKLTLRLNGLDNTPAVSRVYRHLFQAM